MKARLKKVPLLAVAVSLLLAANLVAQVVGIATYGGNSGWFVTSSGLEGRISGNVQLRVDSNNIAIGQGGTTDVGLRRSNTNSLRVTDGGTGMGYISGAQSDFLLTSSSTAATATDAGTMYQNTGQGATRTVTLVDNPVAGVYYDFCVIAAQSITVTPGAGETFRDVGTTGSTQITSNTVGSCMRLMAVAGGSTSAWVVVWKNGTWTIT